MNVTMKLGAYQIFDGAGKTDFLQGPEECRWFEDLKTARESAEHLAGEFPGDVFIVADTDGVEIERFEN